ncbi:hypothetical protein JCM19000A_05480 [Silvimonas sp. JCM 19000]
MMRKLAFTLLVILMAALLVVAPSGYEITLQKDVVLYKTDANIPFDHREVAHNIKKGEIIQVVWCIDNGNDVYFRVEMPDGRHGYLYQLDYKIAKRWVFSKQQYDFFMQNPLAALQCHVMIGEFSDRG